MMFFCGVSMTGVGSGYYHLSPDNDRLVWDRLPMTISFMSLFSIIIMERINIMAGKRLFPVLLTTGLASVWYWHWTENQGQGDLRLYAVVQFFPLLAILLITGLFPDRHSGTKYLFYTLGWYVLAKILEHFDKEFFALAQGIVSGHTLKHIAAAIGTAWMIKYMLCLKNQGLGLPPSPGDGGGNFA